MITLVECKTPRSLNLCLGLGVALAIFTLPSVAMAQTVPGSEAQRAAEIECQLAGVCESLAASENARVKEVRGGVDTRGMMSIGAARSSLPNRAVNSSSSSRRGQPSSNVRVTGANEATLTPALSAGATVASSAYASSSVEPIASPGRARLMINFGLGSDSLTDDSMFEIRSFALAVRNLDEQGLAKRFRIEGHADSSGSEAINLPLSDRRAAAVRSMLIKAGIDTGRIDFVGYGSQRPLSGLSPSDSLNRRVEAVLVE